jgi:S1-C subfamily serine protease
MRNTDRTAGPGKSGRVLWTFFLVVIMAASPSAFGQVQTPSPGVDTLLAAIVGVRALVPEDARTAQALGTQRVGSGVVIDSHGLIVTIGYLILEASHVQVMVAENTLLDAEILAYDHDTGFGLLRASEPIDVTPMGLGDSSGLGKGDQLLVSGFGGRQAARPAVLVSRRNFAGYWEYLLEDAIFTAPPYPLFGGAALINGQGELVGIGSLVVPDAYRGDQPLPGNVFLPVNRLKSVLGDLLTVGRSSAVSRPWLGLYLNEVDNLLIVQRLAVDGPAAGAGMQAGDIVLGVAGQPVSSMEDFYRKLWAMGEPGDNIPLTVLKGAQIHEINITAGDRYKWLHLP